MTSINTVELGTLFATATGRKRHGVRAVRQTVFLPGTYTSHLVMNSQGHIHAMTENSIVFSPRQFCMELVQVDHQWGCVYSDVDFSVNSEQRLRLDRESSE